MRKKNCANFHPQVGLKIVVDMGKKCEKVYTKIEEVKAWPDGDFSIRTSGSPAQTFYPLTGTCRLPTKYEYEMFYAY